MGRSNRVVPAPVDDVGSTGEINSRDPSYDDMPNSQIAESADRKQI